MLQLSGAQLLAAHTRETPSMLHPPVSAGTAARGAEFDVTVYAIVELAATSATDHPSQVCEARFMMILSLDFSV